MARASRARSGGGAASNGDSANMTWPEIFAQHVSILERHHNIMSSMRMEAAKSSVKHGVFMACVERAKQALDDAKAVSRELGDSNGTAESADYISLDKTFAFESSLPHRQGNLQTDATGPNGATATNNMFVFDSQPAPIKISVGGGASHKRTAGGRNNDSPAEGKSRSKKAKTKHADSATNGEDEVERNDITERVEERLREKEEKRRQKEKKTDKKRKRESEADTEVEMTTAEGETGTDQPGAATGAGTEAEGGEDAEAEGDSGLEKPTKKKAKNSKNDHGGKRERKDKKERREKKEKKKKEKRERRAAAAASRRSRPKNKDKYNPETRKKGRFQRGRGNSAAGAGGGARA